MLDAVRTASVFVAIAGAIVGVAVDPLIIGVLILLAGGTGYIWAHRRAKARNELEIDELVSEPNEALQRNLRALDDFRNVIANGDMPCEERLPDGTVKPVLAQMLRAFRADHGALLILSRDQGIWQCIPRRPIPMSALKLSIEFHPAEVS